jgi:hypothetical protein
MNASTPPWVVWWFCLIVLFGSGLASDVPFVFSEDTDLAGYSSVQLKEASSSSQDLVGVPSVVSPPDNEILEIPVTGGGSTSEGKLEKEAGDLRDELNKKVEPDYRRIREDASILASEYPGDLRIEQICEIYIYLKYGDENKGGWRYVRDPRGIDSWNYANESLQIGDRKNCVGLGDCDDFAILMAAFVESIGGATRIILANNNSIGGHAYAEVYLGRLNDSDRRVEQIIEWLQQEYGVSKIYGHIDTDTKEAWLNLDWGPDKAGNAHPGGPLFQGDKHYVLRIRDEYKLIPLRMSEAINKAPRLISLTSDEVSPQEAGVIVNWTTIAKDADNERIFYRFFLNGDPETRWIDENSWLWTTTEADIGENQIEVRVRDGKHAGPNRFDGSKDEGFTVTESKPAAPENQPPVINGLLPGRESPQEIGSIITWTAMASDPENDPLLFQFSLNGYVVSDWSDSSIWSWTTTSDDIGENQIEVRVRDGKHAISEDDQESVRFSIIVRETAQRMLPPAESGPVEQISITNGDTPVTIQSQGMRGYQVFLDENYIGTEGTGGDPLDGRFNFNVVGNQNHDIRVYDGQFNYPKTMYFSSGVQKIINLEPGTEVYI